MPRPDRVSRRIPALIALIVLAVAAFGVDAVSASGGAAATPTQYRVVLPGIVADSASPGGAGQEWPPDVRQSVIGYSVQGRRIESLSLGDGPVALLLIGGIHGGAESVTTDLVEALFADFATGEDQLPANLTLIAVPNVNPDGRAADTRTNARRVDLNRNWPTADWQQDVVVNDILEPGGGGTSPLSEPETLALYNFVLKAQPRFALSYHGYASLVQDNRVTANGEPIAFAYADAYAEAANYEHLSDWPFYPITGEFIDEMAEDGIAAADVELQQDDPGSFDRNLAGLEATMAAMSGQ